MASEKIMSRSPGLINDERWCWKGRKEGKERQIFIAGINCYLGGIYSRLSTKFPGGEENLCA